MKNILLKITLVIFVLAIIELSFIYYQLKLKDQSIKSIKVQDKITQAKSQIDLGNIGGRDFINGKFSGYIGKVSNISNEKLYVLAKNQIMEAAISAQCSYAHVPWFDSESYAKKEFKQNCEEGVKIGDYVQLLGDYEDSNKMNLKTLLIYE